MTSEKNVQTLGLANRAKKLVYGYDNIRQAIKDNKIICVFALESLDGDSIRQLRSKSKFYNIPLFETLSKEDMFKIVGNNQIKIIGLIDEGFYRIIEK